MNILWGTDAHITCLRALPLDSSFGRECGCGKSMLQIGYYMKHDGAEWTRGLLIPTTMSVRICISYFQPQYDSKLDSFIIPSHVF